MEHSKSSIEIAIDLGLYSETAILKATYKFTGSNYVRIVPVSEKSVTVIFAPKNSAGQLGTLEDEFLNELLDQRLREQISAETLPVRNLIMAYALSKLDLSSATENGPRSSHDNNNLPASE